MKKTKIIRNVLAVLVVLAAVVCVSCDALLENGRRGNITINLPPISSSARAISADKINDLKGDIASYRVIVNANGQRREKSGGGGNYSFEVPVGVKIEITVECLNSSGDVIARARKTHTVKSGTNNISIKLSRDGELVGAAPVPGKVTYYDNGGNGAPGDEQTYDTGNAVTLKTGEPTRAGYTFVGWTSNVALEATDASGGNVQITQSTAFASTSSTAQNVTTKITSFKMPSGGVVLTAKWTPITYTIKFNNGGGSGSQADLQFTVEDTNKKLPTANEVAFTPPIGKAFARWSRTKDGLSTSFTDIVDQIKRATGDLEMSGNYITIYAVWQNSVRTVLYNNGKLIINELPQNRINTVGITEEYEAMKDDGSNYEFAYSALWYDNSSSITSVEIGSAIRPTSISYWFDGMSNCSSIDLTNLDTSRVTNMDGMFSGCPSLNSLNVSNFNTSNVTSMFSMFGSCSELTSLDLSSFDTSKVTTMTYMFNGCSKLATLTFGSNFNTSSVTSMDTMFGGCSSLTSLDLSSFNTSKVSTFEAMFRGCSRLRTIYASTNFVLDMATTYDDMFAGCVNLEGGNGTQFNENIVDATYAWIDGYSDGYGPRGGYFTEKP